MAGDEERPSSEPAAVPDDGVPGEPIVHPEPFGAAPAANGGSLEETARGADPRSEGRRSAMPTVLSVIGVVLIVLLAANLYTLYNPPGNDALTAAVADVGTLKSRVAAVEGKAAGVAGLDERVVALTAEVGGIKGAVARDDGAAAAGAEAKAAVQPLDARITALGSSADARIGELRTGLDMLAGTVAALPKVDLTPLQTQLAGIDKRMGPLEAYFNAPKSTEQVTEIRQNGSAAETRAAPRAVIAQGVLAAIDAGRPFETEVRALGNLGVPEPTLAPLRAVAAKGAATRAELLAGFAGAQDGIVVAAAPVETGTMFDRILANAQGIVKVTRTGAGTGSDAAAIASRIADDLSHGDLPAAAAEWDKLPAASKARSADWSDRLTARIKAADAARSIGTEAVAALAAAP